MHVQLIGESANGGISRDLALLSAGLQACGCTVAVRSCGKPERRQRRSVLLGWRMHVQRRRRHSRVRPFDVNVMLEHVWPQFFAEARYNVVVPNPEWFDPRDVRYLAAFDCVWTKTAAAEQLFRERGFATSPIGFDSEDRLQAGVERINQFLHVAGRSPLKGTARLLALWQRHPEWSTLTVVQDPSTPKAVTAGGSPAANIVCLGEYLSDEAVRTIQNAHRFHVCTSEAEGWGHYIVEAMSVGAVTLTCDAAPMNELVGPGRGLVVASHPGPIQNLVRLSLFDEVALEVAVRKVMALVPAEVSSIGESARGWFLENKAGFRARLGGALEHLNAFAMR